MKFQSLLFIVFVVCGAGCSAEKAGAPAVPAEPHYADTILVNGAVYTMNATRSWAEAVAIRDDKIVFVGDQHGAQALRGPDTRWVDLAGKMLMPAFQDSHIHPISAGREALAVDLNGLDNTADYVAAIKHYADTNPDVPWILGGGWSVAAFGPGALASRKLIDAVVDDRPVYLTSADGHSGWANSKALQLAGIDEDTQNPPSGIVDRDPVSGELIGSLQEGAMELLDVHIPAPAPEAEQQALQYSVDLLNRYGITAINDAMVTEPNLQTYRALDERDALTLRVVASLWWERSAGVEQIAEFERLRSQYTAGNVAATAVKIMQDGVMENFTAAMSEPYLVAGDPTGIPMVEPTFLQTAVTALDAAEFQVHFHAIGDAAITQCLDAVEAARRSNPLADHRHHISHLQAIHPHDLRRFRKLGVIANFQPLWAYADEYITDLTLPFISEERANWLYTIRSVINAGGTVAFGSDWSVSTANPLPQIETAITRFDAEAGTAGAAFMPEESVDLATALAAFTINAAYLNHLDDVSGSVEVGKFADLIVLDQNLFDLPAPQISDAGVVLTLFGGTPVHGDWP